MAMGDVAATNEPAATPYNPAQSLDIAKVVSVTDTAYDVVPATMAYIDHQGQTHKVTYQVMGNCTSNSHTRHHTPHTIIRFTCNAKSCKPAKRVSTRSTTSTLATAPLCISSIESNATPAFSNPRRVEPDNC